MSTIEDLPLELLLDVASRDYTVWRGLLVLRLFASYSITKEAKKNVLDIFSGEWCIEESIYESYLCGELHSYFDYPSRITFDQEYVWHHHGKLHRGGDKPAYKNCCESNYYRDGKLHRDGDLPAMVLHVTSECEKHLKDYSEDDAFEIESDDDFEDPDDMGVSFVRYRPRASFQWFKNGLAHRNGDLPAIISTDQADFTPLAEYISGDKFPIGPITADISFHLDWCKNGKVHRDNDLPAAVSRMAKYVWAFQWYQNDLIHRESNPARIFLISCSGRTYPCGEENCKGKCEKMYCAEWYKHGKRYQEIIFQKGDYLLYEEQPADLYIPVQKN